MLLAQVSLACADVSNSNVFIDVYEHFFIFIKRFTNVLNLFLNDKIKCGFGLLRKLVIFFRGGQLYRPPDYKYV